MHLYLQTFNMRVSLDFLSIFRLGSVIHQFYWYAVYLSTKDKPDLES